MSETNLGRQRTPDNYLAPQEVEQIAKLEAQRQEMRDNLIKYDKTADEMLEAEIKRLKASLADKLEDLEPRKDASA